MAIEGETFYIRNVFQLLITDLCNVILEKPLKIYSIAPIVYINQFTVMLIS